MALSDFMGKAREWMTPERGMAMQAIGQGLSQMAYGQPVNLSPAYQALQQRQRSAQMQRTLQDSGVLQRFTPEQRAILAQMEPGAAQRIIAQTLFSPEPEAKRYNVGGALVDAQGNVIYSAPEDAPEPIEINGQLVDPVTREVVGDYRTQEPQGTGYIATGRRAEALGLDPANAYNISVENGVMKAQQIGSGSGGPDVREVTLPDGSEALVQWNPETEKWDPADIPEGGTGAQPKNKLTESQSKLTLFQSMQEEAAPVLDEMEQVFDPANLGDAAANSVPVIGNFLKSPQGRQYRAAASVWAEGALRIATGAAATQPEIERTIGTYFAQPGDDAATVRFKSSLRAMYSRAIDRALGGSGGTERLMTPDDFADAVMGAPEEGVGSDELEPDEDGFVTIDGVRVRER